MTIVQASFTIVTYDLQNIFIIQATDLISDTLFTPATFVDKRYHFVRHFVRGEEKKVL
jgi:hypothetical protein